MNDDFATFCAKCHTEHAEICVPVLRRWVANPKRYCSRAQIQDFGEMPSGAGEDARTRHLRRLQLF